MPEEIVLLFTGLTTAFFRELLFGLWLTMPVMLALAAAITVLGQIVGRKEGWSFFNSSYWAFITASTVGYGDCYRLAGLTFSGILLPLPFTPPPSLLRHMMPGESLLITCADLGKLKTRHPPRAADRMTKIDI